jgi:hypothetical protein
MIFQFLLLSTASEVLIFTKLPGTLYIGVYGGLLLVAQNIRLRLSGDTI